MKGLVLACLGFFLVGCEFDGAFRRYCDKNPKCDPDAAVQIPVDTGLLPVDAPEPVDALTPVDTFKPPPLDSGDFPRFGDGGTILGGGLPPPRPCDTNGGPGACGPDFICSLGGFCLKTCFTSADCQRVQPYNPRCINLPYLPNYKVCACDGNSCASKDSSFTCSFLDFICLRKCYGDVDCRGPLFTLPRICSVTSQVCTVNSCGTDDDCANINPDMHCDRTTYSCVL